VGKCATVPSVIVERLQVIRDCVTTAERPVVRRRDNRLVGPLFFGPGQADLICGDCTFLLVRGAPRADSIKDAVLVCPNCEACNERPGISVHAARVGDEEDAAPAAGNGA